MAIVRVTPSSVLVDGGGRAVMCSGDHKVLEIESGPPTCETCYSSHILLLKCLYVLCVYYFFLYDSEKCLGIRISICETEIAQRDLAHV